MTPGEPGCHPDDLRNSETAVKAAEIAQPPGLATDAAGTGRTPDKPPSRALLAGLRAKIGDWRGGLAGW